MYDSIILTHSPRIYWGVAYVLCVVGDVGLNTVYEQQALTRACIGVSFELWKPLLVLVPCFRAVAYGAQSDCPAIGLRMWILPPIMCHADYIHRSSDLLMSDMLQPF